MTDAGIIGQKKVLVAPLDWGLGHTTRCIPIIRSLVQRGHNVFLAGNSQQKSLLAPEFPLLPFLSLPGYDIKYGVSVVQTLLLLLRQIPQLKAAIKTEHQWLAQMMTQHHFDAVIADNRYGFYHPSAHCTIITHQLRIRAGVATGLLQRQHYQMLQVFNQCWVPDFPERQGLAGSLSHPRHLPPMPVHYLGPLSRFENNNAESTGSGILILLSGPEPQRTIFENLLLQQIATLDQPVALVRGLPAGGNSLPSLPNLQVFDHLPAQQLEQKLAEAAWVICRSGYSSVMDLVALRKKSILVPTPGQTEQVYLARHLHQSGFALARQQAGFNIKKALEMAAGFRYRFPERANLPYLQQALDEWEAKAGNKRIIDI